MRLISRLRRCLPTSVRLMAITSLVLSRLDYAISVLNGVTKKLVNKLQVILHACVRVHFRLRKFDHISEHFLQLNWLSVEKRIFLRIAVLIWKAIYLRSPVYLSSLLHQHLQNGRPLRSNDQNKLLVVRANTCIGTRSFSVTAPTVWNEIPLEIKDSPSLNSFYYKLVNHLQLSSQ